MTKTLTRKIAYRKLQEFFQEKPMVLFGTGTSCALDTKFGMQALKDYLFTEVPKLTLSNHQVKEWKTVKNALNSNNDFESAMDTVKDEQLLQLLTQTTADLLISLDQNYATALLMGNVSWPAIGLFKRLVDGLSETDRKLHVATPNYDLLAEYAFEQAGIPYITGFIGGVCRHIDWQQCERTVTYVEYIPRRSKVYKTPKLRKHIRLYKVHGSLNTFKLGNRTVENNAWMYQAPVKENIKRMMIMPGTSKHEQLHQNRTDLLGPFDDAVKNHSAFLFIGFGFNDSQIVNDALKAKLKDKKCPGLIITRNSNKRIENWLKECNNLWLVCKHQDENNENARVFNRQYTDWLHLEDNQIWKTDEFTKEILGG